MQESAEEEQSLAGAGVRTDQRNSVPVMTSHISTQSTDSARSVLGAEVTAGSSDVKSASATPLATPL